MTDLAAIRAALNDLPDGEWRGTISKAFRDQLSCNGQQVAAMWNTRQYPGYRVASAMATIMNAIREMADELEDRRNHG